MMRGAISLDLTAVEAPVLLVTGALDESADPLLTDAMAEAIGGSVTRLALPNSGHVVTLGPDLPLLVDALERMLQQ
jgi:pimeloyl-ACP methyl ester carboxylesterase